MKLSKRDKNLLLVIGGAAIALCVYYFVFLNLQEKTEALEANNVVLENVIAQLKELDKNKEQYLTDTDTFKEENEEIKALFPAGMEEEDDILYIDGLEGTLSDYYASSIGMPSAVAYELAYPTVEQISVDEMLGAVPTAEAAAETAENTEGTDGASVEGATLEAGTGYGSCRLWYVPVTTSYETNYVSLKQLVKAITEDSDKKSIEDVSITYNEENGILSGSMTSNFYYLSGTEEIYSTPEVNGVSVGTSNPFRSVR